jgi:hypothetical protein
VKSQQDDQRVLEQVVIERAEKLRDEERRETAGFEQEKLGMRR